MLNYSMKSYRDFVLALRYRICKKLVLSWGRITCQYLLNKDSFKLNSLNTHALLSYMTNPNLYCAYFKLFVGFLC